VKLQLMKTSIALTALLTMFPPVRLVVRAHPASPQDIRNAAVKYLRADASLRQSYALPTDAAATLQKALESPLDGEEEKLVASADEALREFHHGASSKRCDWEMSAEDGALANTAHRGAIIELAYVSGLRARLSFRDGNSVGAAGDLIAGITAARHLSVDGSLASVLFAYKLENALSGVLAQNLFRVSLAELKELQNSIGSLPSAFSLGTAFVEEKVHRNDFSTIAREAKSRDDVINLLLKQLPVLESNRASSTEIVDGYDGTLKGFQSCVCQQESFYADWALADLVCHLKTSSVNTTTRLKNFLRTTRLSGSLLHRATFSLGRSLLPNSPRFAATIPAITTPEKRKRGKCMSRRSQVGSIERSGKWYVVWFWKDIPAKKSGFTLPSVFVRLLVREV
jgi:hypothetical protein